MDSVLLEDVDRPVELLQVHARLGQVEVRQGPRRLQADRFTEGRGGVLEAPHAPVADPQVDQQADVLGLPGPQPLEGRHRTLRLRAEQCDGGVELGAEAGALGFDLVGPRIAPLYSASSGLAAAASWLTVG